jgi:hypothetical protein
VAEWRVRGEQTVLISARVTSFTAVCEDCGELDRLNGWGTSTFAGRLDLDLTHGTFLCRRGHQIRVEREPAAPASREAGGAAA